MPGIHKLNFFWLQNTFLTSFTWKLNNQTNGQPRPVCLTNIQHFLLFLTGLNFWRCKLKYIWFISDFYSKKIKRTLFSFDVLNAAKIYYVVELLLGNLGNFKKILFGILFFSYAITTRLFDLKFNYLFQATQQNKKQKMLGEMINFQQVNLLKIRALRSSYGWVDFFWSIETKLTALKNTNMYLWYSKYF